jgi:hypothetical protein
MRRPAILIGALLLLPASVAFAATNPDILVSGQMTMATIDGDGNGPDAMDCHFMATTDAMGNFVVSSMQDAHTPLRACSGPYGGNVDPTFPTDTSVSGIFTSSGIVGGANVPYSFDGIFVPQAGGAASGGAAANDPRFVSRLELSDGSSGRVCDGNAQVTLANGLPLLVSIDMDMPGFVRVRNVPFEKADFSGFVLKDVFVPKVGGVVTFSLSNDPTNILIQLLLTGSCGRGAPTLSGGGLILLALALLAGGTWLLGRRQRFYGALPLP